MHKKNQIQKTGIMLKIIFALSLLLFFACEKIEDTKILKVKTDEVTDISATTATAKGTIVDPGEEDLLQHGFCWSVTPNPLVTILTKTELGKSDAATTFSSNITDLSSNTKYYLKAYVTNTSRTIYGNEMEFITSHGKPIITTTAVTGITSNSAISGGVITSNGGTLIFTKGVCWGINSSPTIASDTTNNGMASGRFTSLMQNLSANTTYYVRAYATNQIGTGYGDELVFKTENTP